MLGRSWARHVLSTRGRVVTVALAAGLSAAGCGSHVQRSEGSHQVARPVPLGSHVTAPPVRVCTTAPVALGSRRVAYAALVPRSAVARAAPGSGTVVGRLGHLDVNRLPTVLGVIAVKTNRRCDPGWYRVQLAVVPNGTTGWIAAHSLRVYRVTSRIVVSLSDRSLALYRSGTRVLRARVAIGAPHTPTPTGRFFVNERYVLTDPNGPFGVAALGISAHSNVLHDWTEGGPIALHGTNEPSTIGDAASHGCIRLDNSIMQRLLRLSPAGTPVLIRR
ncbi:MAG TPA: L,D-transpeptidase [Gaiellaceae bacterium]|nr:L,D-transpeptidase [Gaiellaceae bacterium]